MHRLLLVFFMATPMLVGCGDVPAPAQYDQTMLQEFFGKSAQEVEATFGKSSSAMRADAKSGPKAESAEDVEETNISTESGSLTYSTADGDLVFHFNLEDEVSAIDYLGRTVSPPKSKAP